MAFLLHLCSLSRQAARGNSPFSIIVLHSPTKKALVEEIFSLDAALCRSMARDCGHMEPPCGLARPSFGGRSAEYLRLMSWLKERSQDLSSYSPYRAAIHENVDGVEARSVIAPESMNAAEDREDA
jgi:hypothetical protein